MNSEERWSPPRRYLKSTKSGSITITPATGGTMFTFNYYELYRNSKDPVQYRGMLVEYALKYGIKPTAREFKTTPKTVRKWVERYKAEKKPGLQNRSRKPHRSPNQIKPYWYYKIQDICTQAQTPHKRITAAWIQKTYTIPYSTRTICKKKVLHWIYYKQSLQL